MDLFFVGVPTLAFLIFAVVFVGLFGSIFVRLIGGGLSGRRGGLQQNFDRVMDLAEEQVRARHEERHAHRRHPAARSSAPPPLPREERGPLDFQCDHCGATAEGPLDISPSGDVKCAYCGKWFNVR